jgi:hypothetical protein
MRRSFNDLMRLATLEAIVTKSISGHQTDRMRAPRQSGEGPRASGEETKKATRG